MSLIDIDGHLLKKMIIAGSNKLEENKQLVDSLNVFPVPDGDTGTNMSLTVFSAAKEADKLNTPNVYDIAKAISGGSLRGARGNSGVILSQLFRGFAKGFEGKALANTDDFAEALSMASQMAYKAVMKPKEGTILTVAKALADKAVEVALDIEDVEEFLKEIISYGNIVLNKTTFMLKELKDAGVVDAGGKGYILILEGMLEAINIKDHIKIGVESAATNADIKGTAFSDINTQDIKYSYCTEFFINKTEVIIGADKILKPFLDNMGDSIVLVEDDDIVKIHIHTNNPGKVIERAITLGDLDNVKIENMRLQHTNLINFSKNTTETVISEEKPKTKQLGFVSVAMGEGICELFRSLGADKVIEGGQTMNPSTEDILAAIENVDAENVIVFPNNKNIVLTANLAAELCTSKRVYVLPTKTIPQGISALTIYSETNAIEENLVLMREALETVLTGHLTFAVRDTVIGNKEIKKGNILCMLEGEIVLVAEDLQQGAKQLIDLMAKDNDILTVYYGSDVTRDSANELCDYASKNYPNFEVECYEGKQPIYYYIISAE